SSPLFSFTALATSALYTLSLHDALPISRRDALDRAGRRGGVERRRSAPAALAVARVASRSRGPRQGGRGGKAAGAGGARCGRAHHGAGEKTGWGRLRRG